MRKAALALAASLIIADPAAAQVEGVSTGVVHVRYVAPERFTDVEDDFSLGPPRRVILAEMTRIFERLGGERLRRGETLDITVHDIDLAGFDRPGFGGGNGVRVVNEATPPSIKLAYVLRRGDRVLSRGEETVTDINFMLTANPRFSGGILYYERALLRNWFAKHFPGSPDARG